MNMKAKVQRVEPRSNAEELCARARACVYVCVCGCVCVCVCLSPPPPPPNLCCCFRLVLNEPILHLSYGGSWPFICNISVSKLPYLTILPEQSSGTGLMAEPRGPEKLNDVPRDGTSEACTRVSVCPWQTGRGTYKYILVSQERFVFQRKDWKKRVPAPLATRHHHHHHSKDHYLIGAMSAVKRLLDSSDLFLLVDTTRALSWLGVFSPSFLLYFLLVFFQLDCYSGQAVKRLPSVRGIRESPLGRV